MAQLSKIAGSAGRRFALLTTLITAVVGLGFSNPATGGSYRDSAHGNAAHGVNRSAIDPKFEEYATGNCAHCHEMHASIDGVEPQPLTGAAPHTLFAPGFNPARTENFYLETDNFCFSCHSTDFGQRVLNRDYSATFGGAAAGSGPQSILDAFNQNSYHNLNDISNFLRNSPIPAFSWFSGTSNPCSACHNPHLARRNHDPGQPGFPLLSAISRPNDHLRLWGETEVMAAYTSYEAPYAFDLNREPAGAGDFEGDKTPDYVGFCSSCHNQDNIIWSTTLNREIKKINWRVTGEKRDKHGALSRDGTDNFREPYQAAASVKSNLVLSCLDCHEPHGAQNIMLLRRRVNGENLEGTMTSTADLGHLCRRCHQDDLAAAAGTAEANRWEYVHHLAPGAPYSQTSCANCHETGDGGMGSGQASPVACGNCHGHGMNDDWAGTVKSGRTTF